MSVDGQQGLIAALLSLRREKNPNLKIILSLGGATGSKHFANVAKDKRKSARLCETARGMVDHFGFDGIDGQYGHKHRIWRMS